MKLYEIDLDQILQDRKDLRKIAEIALANQLKYSEEVNSNIEENNRVLDLRLRNNIIVNDSLLLKYAHIMQSIDKHDTSLYSVKSYKTRKSLSEKLRDKYLDYRLI